MSRGQVSRQDWLNAALDALADGGVAAVRVDVLARRLGMTRGSFYWHFKDRDALVAAALEEWELVCTTRTIEQLETIADPGERLRTLLTHALDIEALSRLEPAIVAHAGDPVVAPILRRVTERRVDFLAEVYAELGYDRGDARHQALVAYAAYTGWLQLRSTAPDVLPELADAGRTGEVARAYLADRLISRPVSR
ncbi:TetR/AcrR family transcriptional regulator [Solicola gregarius]|uniref:TetR/AcrR family transcriptional regulator n=1 Tax=Solicola gregarius TaxID=2908642 RepID=A0AA46TLN3_9ACTN|nr:TetR/AcrR family transcriptional regulator [Solicola gregarius]UYM06713.1 TetR/AcrR family transcriptional regulator [Solicola gregarius]